LRPLTDPTALAEATFTPAAYRSAEQSEVAHEDKVILKIS